MAQCPPTAPFKRHTGSSKSLQNSSKICTHQFYLPGPSPDHSHGSLLKSLHYMDKYFLEGRHQTWTQYSTNVVFSNIITSLHLLSTPVCSPKDYIYSQPFHLNRSLWLVDYPSSLFQLFLSKVVSHSVTTTYSILRFITTLHLSILKPHFVLSLNWAAF